MSDYTLEAMTDDHKYKPLPLVPRLRTLAVKFGMPIGDEAADEIDTLRAQLSEARKETEALRKWHDDVMAKDSAIFAGVHLIVRPKPLAAQQQSDK